MTCLVASISCVFSYWMCLLVNVQLLEVFTVEWSITTVLQMFMLSLLLNFQFLEVFVLTFVICLTVFCNAGNIPSSMRDVFSMVTAFERPTCGNAISRGISEQVPR